VRSVHYVMAAALLGWSRLNWSRRKFLARSGLGLLGTAAAAKQTQSPPDLTPGAPPTFGTAPAVGPEVSQSTFVEAERLVQVNLSGSHRALAARSWRTTMAALYERRTGPRKIALEPGLAPWSRWQAVLPGKKAGPDRGQFIRSKIDPGPLPASDEDLAFAPLTQLSRWIEERQLSSQRLTQVYLDRLGRFNPKLRCVITLTRELALTQARKADEEIAASAHKLGLTGALDRRQALAVLAELASAPGAIGATARFARARFLLRKQ